MAYRDDADLKFLGEMSSEELHDLFRCLTEDKDGGSLLTEELTASDEYKKHGPNHSKYWQLIAAELQCFGANTFTTLLRGGKGVLYREVLCDVADKLKVKYDKKDSILDIENKLLSKVLESAIDKMTETERQNFAKTLGIINLKTFTPATMVAAAQIAFKAGGFKSFQLTLVIANAVSRAILGRGIALAGNAALVRSASILAGPIGWGITGAWTLVDVAGPAYRVTIPAVIQVVLLRKKYIVKREGLIKDIEKELNVNLAL